MKDRDGVVLPPAPDGFCTQMAVGSAGHRMLNEYCRGVAEIGGQVVAIILAGPDRVIVVVHEPLPPVDETVEAR